jgi:hypothetical protein
LGQWHDGRDVTSSYSVLALPAFQDGYAGPIPATRFALQGQEEWQSNSLLSHFKIRRAGAQRVRRKGLWWERVGNQQGYVGYP